MTWGGRPAPGLEPLAIDVPSHAGPPVLPWEHTRHPLGVWRPEVTKGEAGSQPRPAGPVPLGCPARTARRFPARGPPGSGHVLHVDSALAPQKPKEWMGHPSPHSAPPFPLPEAILNAPEPQAPELKIPPRMACGKAAPGYFSGLVLLGSLRAARAGRAAAPALLRPLWAHTGARPLRACGARWQGPPVCRTWAEPGSPRARESQSPHLTARKRLRPEGRPASSPRSQCHLPWGPGQPPLCGRSSPP